MIGLGELHPNLFRATLKIIRSLDCHRVLMKMMLSFLLFAGSIHMNVRKLWKERRSVLTFSTIGVLSQRLLQQAFLISPAIFLFTYQFYLLSFILRTYLTYQIIAVMEVLKNTHIPKSSEMKISDASLFNDGIVVLIFLPF